MSRNSHRQGAISLVKLILSCLCPVSLFSRGRERFFQDTERCGWLGDCLARVFEEIRNVLRRHWEKRKVLQVASEVPSCLVLLRVMKMAAFCTLPLPSLAFPGRESCRVPPRRLHLRKAWLSLCQEDCNNTYRIHLERQG